MKSRRVICVMTSCTISVRQSFTMLVTTSTVRIFEAMQKDRKTNDSGYDYEYKKKKNNSDNIHITSSFRKQTNEVVTQRTLFLLQLCSRTSCHYLRHSKRLQACRINNNSAFLHYQYRICIP